MRLSNQTKTEYERTLEGFRGGLNLQKAEYCLPSDETPEMKNLLWRDGFLASRKGQTYLQSIGPGAGLALYEGVWHGYLFAHIGFRLYAIHAATGAYTDLGVSIQPVGGTFFLYGGDLYYKSYASYRKITAQQDGQGEWSFTCSPVLAYVPVTVINANHADGSGDLYQPENRYSPQKTVWFNAALGVTEFFLPVKPDYITKVVVDGVELFTGWTFNQTHGSVIFNVAPPVTNPPTNNTVRITYSKSNISAYNSVNFARYAATYGGTGELCVVLAGSELMRNAYFWSGNSDVAMDPGYFPMDQYQIAGETENPLTGFGKQQSDLIIFQEHSVGKTTLGVTELNGRNTIDMPYTPINAKIGCKYPWTIELVRNNLVWATDSGVYMLLDTTEANENFMKRISDKVHGEPPRIGVLPKKPGLLYDLSVSDPHQVCACDDGRKFCLLANGHAWVWDYELSGTGDPSWFYLDNIPGIGIAYDENELYQLTADGKTVKLQEAFSDFGQPIERLFRLPAQTFDSFDTRKNVNSVIIAMSAEHETNTELTYHTDYGSYTDGTNLQVVPENTYQQNRTPGTRPQSDTIMAVFRRRPMCRRISHFSFTLCNRNANEDMSLGSVRICYSKQGRLR